MPSLRDITDDLFREEETLRLGGGAEGQERQRRHSRLPVRERLALLLDEDRPFFELGLWAAYGMYAE
ncbi:MAG TPA: acyl-CoA carboxylase subunit beta, partial [Lacipirellulaceae bacterium]|nr:acyl-CoA carboxylase subunit beta [Lacipirellulaceae bacterium]